jgi:hypothetical protein
MSNRVSYFIRSILQNSKLNREKFVNNKKIYNQFIAKNKQQNNNRIIIRKMSTIPPLSFGSTGGGGGGKGPKDPKWDSFIIMGILSMGIVIPQYLTDRKR